MFSQKLNWKNKLYFSKKTQNYFSPSDQKTDNMNTFNSHRRDAISLYIFYEQVELHHALYESL